jgi:hypothetical protein
MFFSASSRARADTKNPCFKSDLFKIRPKNDAVIDCRVLDSGVYKKGIKNFNEMKLVGL